MKATTRFMTSSMRSLLLVAVAAGWTGDARAQSPASNPTAAVADAIAGKGETTTPTAAPQSGIKVHGHWTMTIRNEDGSIASRHEFENAIGSSGGPFLAAILGRARVPGGFEVGLGGIVCHSATGTPAPCFIAEETFPSPDTPNRFFNLTVGSSGPSFEKILLTGSARATFAGNISFVETTLVTCPPTTSPSTCRRFMAPSFSFGQLTFHQLETPATVSVNQTIEVTVEISFR